MTPLSFASLNPAVPDVTQLWSRNWRCGWLSFLHRYRIHTSLQLWNNSSILLGFEWVVTYIELPLVRNFFPPCWLRFNQELLYWKNSLNTKTSLHGLIDYEKAVVQALHRQGAHEVYVQTVSNMHLRRLHSHPTPLQEEQKNSAQEMCPTWGYDLPDISFTACLEEVCKCLDREEKGIVISANQHLISW